MNKPSIATRLVKDLKSTSDSVHHGNSSRENPISTSMADNEALVSQAMEQNTGGWLHRILPDNRRRLTLGAERDELAAGFEYRRKSLQLAVDSKLQAVEEACNHVLVTGKSEIRRERQEFFADQVSRLAMSMHNYAEAFNTEIDQRLMEIERKYQTEIIREKERQRLIRQIEDFHIVLEEMATEFQQIINEGVKANGTGESWQSHV